MGRVAFSCGCTIPGSWELGLFTSRLSSHSLCLTCKHLSRQQSLKRRKNEERPHTKDSILLVTLEYLTWHLIQRHSCDCVQVRQHNLVIFRLRPSIAQSFLNSVGVGAINFVVFIPCEMK